MHVTTRLAGSLAAVALALGAATMPVGHAADDAAPEPCAQQQAQLDRAESALARLTAVFERQQTRVAKAKKDVAQADTARERREARRGLDRAKEAKADAKAAKKAQVQRVAKAQERRDACQAAQAEPPAETPVEG